MNQIHQELLGKTTQIRETLDKGRITEVRYYGYDDNGIFCKFDDAEIDIKEKNDDDDWDWVEVNDNRLKYKNRNGSFTLNFCFRGGYIPY